MADTKPDTKPDTLSDIECERYEIINCPRRSERTKRRALAAIVRRQRRARRS